MFVFRAYVLSMLLQNLYLPADVCIGFEYTNCKRMNNNCLEVRIIHTTKVL
jgi:hypothetical protein